MAEELAQAGVNLNFGPVVDLNSYPGNPVIARRKRSFGADPKAVAALARAFITAHREANVVTAAKHFPGHGSNRSDSHKVLADISQSWRESELEPYRLLARDGLLDMVMVGAPLSSALQRRRRCAGVSVGAGDRGAPGRRLYRLQGRRGQRRHGDERKSYSREDRVVMAINAGTDLLVFSNVKTRDPELGVKIHAIIADAVRDGRIPRIEEAYGRILLLKRRLMQHDLAGKW
jgi:beta-N-acetylhexosaminidase